MEKRLAITPGNTDDRESFERMTQGLTGTICGDKGYISKHLHNQLSKIGLKLTTNVRKNMKNTCKSVYDTFLLGKRRIIESVFEECTYHAHIMHTSNIQDTEAFLHVTDFDRFQAIYVETELTLIE